MLIDGRRIPDGEQIDADICVIGAGAAGITICNELKQSGFQVLLLEAGGRRHDKAVQAIYAGESLSPHVHAPPSMYRQRRFGGTTTIWGGRCVPLDPIDFESRDWVANSGWPFLRRDLDTYYGRAMPYFEAGDYAFNERDALHDWQPLVEGFVSDTIDTEVVERCSAHTDFGKIHGRTLFSSPRVRVVQKASCLEFVQADQSRIVSHIRCSTAAGNQFEVKATCFILAAGGLESTRLLLSSNRSNVDGLGNENGLLGRNYMCHIEGSLAAIKLHPNTRPVVWAFERSKDGVYIKRRLHVREDEQRRQKTLNTIFRLHHANPADSAHRNPILSAMYLTKQFLIPEYRRKVAMIEYSYQEQRKTNLPLLTEHLSNVLRGFPALASFAATWLVKRHLNYHRIPYVSLHSAHGLYPLDFNAEQVPNPDSRVILSNRRDAFGMQELTIDWRMTEQDILSIVRNHSVLEKAVVESGIGELEFFDPDIDAAARRSVPVGGHHIGTARMSKDSRSG